MDKTCNNINSGHLWSNWLQCNNISIEEKNALCAKWNTGGVPWREGSIPGLDWTRGWNLYDFKFYRLLQCLTWPPRAMLGTMIAHPTPFPERLTVQETEKAGVSANDHNAWQSHFWFNWIRIKGGFCNSLITRNEEAGLEICYSFQRLLLGTHIFK